MNLETLARNLYAAREPLGSRVTISIWLWVHPAGSSASVDWGHTPEEARRKAFEHVLESIDAGLAEMDLAMTEDDVRNSVATVLRGHPVYVAGVDAGAIAGALHFDLVGEAGRLQEQLQAELEATGGEGEVQLGALRVSMGAGCPPESNMSAAPETPHHEREGAWLWVRTSGEVGGIGCTYMEALQRATLAALARWESDPDPAAGRLDELLREVVDGAGFRLDGAGLRDAVLQAFLEHVAPAERGHVDAVCCAAWEATS